MKRLKIIVGLIFFNCGIQAQIRVGIEFGEPTQDCQGRGQLCQLEPLKDALNPEGMGVLHLRESELCLQLSNQTCEGYLPNNYCDLKIKLTLPPSLVESLEIKSSGTIAAGRYSTMRSENGMLICF